MANTQVAKSRISEYHKWYVEPFDAHTNEVVARMLGREECAMSFRDVDGVSRDVWKVVPEELVKLNRSSRQLGLKFATFMSYMDGPLHPVTRRR